jgi:beta-fructofuranosidase
MLLAARLKTGPSRRRGCTALCASKDLQQWEVREPFWTPGLYFTHECPDLFRMGDWWYQVYSTFSERHVTHYRMSRSLQGPWRAPENDAFDGRAYYAAKTATDGVRRYLFGWNATRNDERDYQPWQWGGNLVVHEVVQEADGTLSVRAPDSIDRAFARDVPYRVQPGLGHCEIDANRVRLTAPGSFGCASAGPMPGRCRIEATVVFDANTRGCGLMLRTSDDFESAYYVRLEPGSQRLVFDSWPRAGDVSHMAELDRPMDLAPGVPVTVTLFIDGTVCEVYAAGRVAMSARMYNLPAGNWGVFVNEGAARFSGIRLTTM